MLLLHFLPFSSLFDEIRQNRPQTAAKVDYVAPLKPAATLKSRLNSIFCPKKHEILTKNAVSRAQNRCIGRLHCAQSNNKRAYIHVHDILSENRTDSFLTSGRF